MALITRSDLKSVLAAWQSGRMSAPDVHRWAEARFAVDAWDCEDDVANEVLAQLDMLDMNLIIKDDVPSLLAMLEAPAGDAASALDQFEGRLSAEDMDRRRKELAGDPTYGPFCRS